MYATSEYAILRPIMSRLQNGHSSGSRPFPKVIVWFLGGIYHTKTLPLLNKALLKIITTEPSLRYLPVLVLANLDLTNVTLAMISLSMLRFGSNSALAKKRLRKNSFSELK